MPNKRKLHPNSLANLLRGRPKKEESEKCDNTPYAEEDNGPKILRQSKRLKTKYGRRKCEVIDAETGDMYYQCEVCDKLFNFFQNLKIHLHVHTNDGKYRCSFCEKRFPLKSRLVLHLRTHTGERPYFCRLCLQRFSRNDNCRTHEKKYCKNRNKNVT